MPIREIAPSYWQEELDSFSRQHEGWIVSIKTRDPDGRVALEVRDLPLQGVSPSSTQFVDIAITVGGPKEHLTHEVHAPAAVKLELTNNRAERALIIDGKDGTTTTVEFRSPMRPEDVDGLPIVGS
jgi:hypothetical protein